MIPGFDNVTKGFSPHLWHVTAFELVSVPHYVTKVAFYHFGQKTKDNISE